MAQQIKQFLHQFLAHYHKDDNWQVYVMRNWRTIIGDLYIRMNIEAITNDTLVLGVYDPHWMQELYVLSEVLLETINGALAKPYIKRIRFVLAKQRNGKLEHISKYMPSKIAVKNSRMTERHRAALAVVKDEQLQNILQELLQYCGH